ncbi:MAG: chemotaxis protein CheW [Burkholderiaceae bacterium]
MSCPEDLVAHMRRVLVAERDLHDLGVVWRLIESSAAISCPAEAAAILPTLIGTRERFDALHQRLTEQMADETQAELADELAAKAQCAIDILVRNLYERTADVGFLAVDDAVRAFCAADAATQAADRAAMRQRLADYQRKYTVYDDVLLIAPDGSLLARLDEAGGEPPVHARREPLIAQALSAAGFCERFGASDLAAPGQPAALLYAHRVLGPEGQIAGVLVLRFRFEDEMARIFADVAGERPQIALMLVDAQQRVIASSDAAHVPLGARMVLAASNEPGMQLTQFAGREYLGLHCAGTPYQGYPGPGGWRAVAMVSLLTAFSGRRDAGTPTAEEADGAVSQGRLAAIRDDADAINRELRRVVWNGRLMARAQTGDRLRLTAVLRQVSAAGVRTQTRVNQAIGEIGATALARGRQRARDMARLAIDILDRNLSERANDCRWWALSPMLRETLAGADPRAQSTALTALLNHINGLYTVYSRLVVFDAEGRICGASAGPAGDDPAEALLGQAVPAGVLAAVRALPDAQRYAATAFDDSAWHTQGATYTYLAAVRDPANDSRIVGGVAIVFNAAREFKAILDDILGGREGLAAFVDAEGRVLSATAGFETALLGFDGAQGVVEHGGQRYLLARVAGGGYREFKRDDGYDNGVHAVVGLALGTVERRRSGAGHAELRPATLPARAAAMADDAPLDELALFSVGGGCYALPAHQVIEASPARGLVRTPSAGTAGLGLLDVQGPTGSNLVKVLCARQLLGVQRPARAGDGVVLVLRAEGVDGATMRVGLQVDDVLSVLEMDPRRHYHPAPPGFQSFAPWVTGMADCQRESDGSAQLVQRLDVHALLRAAGLPALVATETPAQAAGQADSAVSADTGPAAIPVAG